MSARLVPVKTYDSRLDADTARSLLASEGITAYVFADDAGGMYPSLPPLRGVKLMVPEDEAVQALEILDQRRAQDS